MPEVTHRLAEAVVGRAVRRKGLAGIANSTAQWLYLISAVEILSAIFLYLTTLHRHGLSIDDAKIASYIMGSIGVATLITAVVLHRTRRKSAAGLLIVLAFIGAFEGAFLGQIAGLILYLVALYLGLRFLLAYRLHRNNQGIEATP